MHRQGRGHNTAGSVVTKGPETPQQWVTAKTIFDSNALAHRKAKMAGFDHPYTITDASQLSIKQDDLLFATGEPIGRSAVGRKTSQASTSGNSNSRYVLADFSGEVSGATDRSSPNDEITRLYKYLPVGFSANLVRYDEIANGTSQEATLGITAVAMGSGNTFHSGNETIGLGQTWAAPPPPSGKLEAHDHKKRCRHPKEEHRDSVRPMKVPFTYNLIRSVQEKVAAILTDDKFIFNFQSLFSGTVTNHIHYLALARGYKMAVAFVDIHAATGGGNPELLSEQLNLVPGGTVHNENVTIGDFRKHLKRMFSAHLSADASVAAQNDIKATLITWGPEQKAKFVNQIQAASILEEQAIIDAARVMAIHARGVALEIAEPGKMFHHLSYT